MILVDGKKTSEFGMTYYITYRELYNAVKAGQVIPYENNRGANGTSQSRVDRYAEKFEPGFFGMIYVEKTDTTDIFKEITGHHRVGALVQAVDDGEVTDTVLDTVFPFSVVEKGKGLSVYGAEGSSKGHTKRAKITNPDLGLGQILEKIITQVKAPSPLDVEDVVRPQYQNAIIYTTLKVQTTSSSDWIKLNYADICRNKKSGTEVYVDLTPDELEEVLKITASTQKKVADSLQWVVEVYYNFIKRNMDDPKKISINRLPDYASDLLRQASFFGLLLWAKVSDVPFTRAKPDRVARKMKKNNQKILKNAKLLRLNEDAATESIKHILGAAVD